MEKSKYEGKIYFGTNSGIGPQTIFVSSPSSAPYLLPHVKRHSPGGFQWGYGGSGPADVAFSILVDLIGEKIAGIYYQQFKRDFIAIAGRDLRIHETAIRSWFVAQEKLREKKQGL